MSESMIDAAVVLEGGSLRGVFTSAVLDVLLEKEIICSYVNGVSAGSMNGMNYISGQVGRTMVINRKFVRDKRYLSFENMMKNRQVFNFDFLFGEISNNQVPFDYEAFYKSPQKFEAVATRCRTGKPEYFEKSTCSDMMAAVQASSSMPLLSKMITVDGHQYLDGGVSMPIAYRRAMELGYEKIVVILTRHHGYRKPPMKPLVQKAYEHYFGPLPEFLASLKEVPNRYNRMQEELDELEAQGRIFIIRPEFPVTVSRMERNIRKLEALYEEGRRIAEERLPELREYLGIDERP